MFAQIPTAVRKKLWPHQVDALDFAIGHLNRFDSPCLIRMPTGTGKTGVIACLTRLLNEGSSLVLTPWANLRQQMVRALDSDFWQVVAVKPGKPNVVEMLPSTAQEVLGVAEPQVIVATFTTLNELRRDHSATYESLASAISLVIADECHYEPAVEWGKSVKGLKTRTVLLTATPYRNDLKLFRISDTQSHTHHFTHKLAVEQKIIRRLTFEELDASTDIASLSTAFAKRWKNAKRNKKLPSADPRAIVCCAGASDIEAAVSHLRKAGLKAIGVHEQFENSSTPHLLKNAPDPTAEKAEIWVHQHKLTEGLDDHRFSCVALFTRIRNDRKLIQQIGRILRTVAEDNLKPALVLTPREFSVENEWSAYLEFESNLHLLEPKHFRDVVESLLHSQPAVEYFEGKFRRRFSPESLQNQPQVVISPSVLVRTTLKGFSIDGYVEDCTDTLNTEDAIILGPQMNAPCQRSDVFALWVYASVRNSRLLQNTSLYEIKLETHCVVVADGYVLVTDSRGFFPTEYLEEYTAGVSQEKLARFLDATFRPTHVSVDSSIPYDTVIRGADLYGNDLLRIPPSLTDRIQICRAARGTSKTSGRRYIGISSGRLRKEETSEERRTFEPPKFVDWAKSVAEILNSVASPSSLFRRYMPTCEPPASPVPKTISLDLLRSNLHLTLSDGSSCTLGSSSSDIELKHSDGASYVCSFKVIADSATTAPLSLRLTYDHGKRRFWFNKDAGPSVQVHLPDTDDSKNRSLAEFLNQNQDIVLIGLEGGEIVYQGRYFYRIDYKYAEQVLLDLITRPSSPSTRTEKGTKEDVEAAKKAKAKRFPENSIFRAVAEQLISFPFNDALLVCADLGTECADFVAADFDSRQLALIHAKAGKGSRISASAFHDVVAQAMKNLVYLTRSADTPKGVTGWRAGNKWNGTGVARLYRSPLGAPSGKTLWNKLRSDILGASNPGLYVVLVTTGCCYLPDLKAAVADASKRTPETAQLLHLLDGLNGYARQLGVSLVIYDLPYKDSPMVVRRKTS